VELLVFGLAIGLMVGFTLGSISVREENRAVAAQRERREQRQGPAEVVVAELVEEPRRLPG
jgi:F0F1-type ATP synthase assembly protein I